MLMYDVARRAATASPTTRPAPPPPPPLPLPPPLPPPALNPKPGRAILVVPVLPNSGSCSATSAFPGSAELW